MDRNANFKGIAVHLHSTVFMLWQYTNGRENYYIEKPFIFHNMG